MQDKKFVLVLGGARSGKSEFAEQEADRLGGPVTYIATMDPADQESARRVAAHRQRRPTGWRTVEETRNLPGRVAEAGLETGVVLVDCLTLWLTNLLLDDQIPHPGAGEEEKEFYINSQVELLASAAKASRSSVLLVANEVGLGLVPPYPLGRVFRDLAGRANRQLAAAADEVYLVVAGLAVEIKSRAVRTGIGN